MKLRNLYIGAALMSSVMMFTACSDSYLDIEPITDMSNENLMNESVARTAMDGVYEAMNTIWDGIDLNQNTGEAYTRTVFNDCLGIDYISGIWTDMASMPGLEGWSRMNSDTEFVAAYPYQYYFGLIGQCNRLIETMAFTSEEHTGVSDGLLFIKAEALTMRSHAYRQLMSLYGQRWIDSDNGEAYCFPLKLTSNQDAVPLVTMNTVFDQVYADLDEAIALFRETTTKRSNKWGVNEDVAHGIYARMALLKNDWRKAADEAELAMQNYSVMEEKDLFAGFFSDNDDLMWCLNPDPGIGTWSWGRHYACNGGYINYWGFGGGAINLDLYNQLDKDDLRRKFFWMPDKMTSLSKIENPAGFKEADFWNPNYVAGNGFLNMNVGEKYDKNKKTGGMVNALANWLIKYYEEVFTGDREEVAPADGFYNYVFITQTVKDSKKSVDVKTDNGRMYATVVNIPFGGQCKFWGAGGNQNGMLPWMRASEMALTRAEALAELGDAQAATVFTDFQKKRVANYTCKSSGQALIEEIRVSRRAELWGEGQNFTDIKRWNMEHIRRVWEANDPNSGNWIPGTVQTEAAKSTTYSNGWRVALPTIEWQYNSDVDRALLKTFN